MQLNQPAGIRLTWHPPKTVGCVWRIRPIRATPCYTWTFGIELGNSTSGSWCMAVPQGISDSCEESWMVARTQATPAVGTNTRATPVSPPPPNGRCGTKGRNGGGRGGEAFFGVTHISPSTVRRLVHHPPNAVRQLRAHCAARASSSRPSPASPAPAHSPKDQVSVGPPHHIIPSQHQQASHTLQPRTMRTCAPARHWQPQRPAAAAIDGASQRLLSVKAAWPNLEDRDPGQRKFSFLQKSKVA